jgi:hypothetical protein
MQARVHVHLHPFCFLPSSDAAPLLSQLPRQRYNITSGNMETLAALLIEKGTRPQRLPDPTTHFCV